jgi:hypothetical protein
MLDTLTESNVVAVGENDMKRTGCVKSYLRSICTVKGVLSGNLLNHILLMYQSSCSCANATVIGLRILKLNFEQELCTYIFVKKKTLTLRCIFFINLTISAAVT